MWKNMKEEGPTKSNSSVLGVMLGKVGMARGYEVGFLFSKVRILEARRDFMSLSSLEEKRENGCTYSTRNQPWRRMTASPTSARVGSISL